MLTRKVEYVGQGHLLLVTNHIITPYTFSKFNINLS